MHPADWKHTVIGTLHPALSDRLQLAPDEKVLTSAFLDDADWYAFTTRRVICSHESSIQEVDPTNGLESNFGNFKGYLDGDNRSLGTIPREIAVTSARGSGSAVRFEYETGKASMAPIYAARYWELKHPILHKLVTPSERNTR